MQSDNNIFRENCLVVIEDNGEIISLPRIQGEKNHGCAFTRLEKLIPDILSGYNGERDTSSGFELANFVAANGRVIFWPTNINDPEYMIVTLPQIPSVLQSNHVEKIFPMLNDFSVYVNTAHYKSPRSPRIISTPLCSSGDYSDAEKKVMNYLCLSSMLNEPQHIAEFQTDISKGRK